MADDTFTISEAVSDLALIALDQAMTNRRDGQGFNPFVLLADGETCYVRRCGEDTVNDAAAFLTHAAEATSTYALAYDGTVTVEGTDFNAVLVIAGEPGADAFVFTQRYDAATAARIGEPALIGQHDALVPAPALAEVP
jgi:hypothetical protein